MLEVDIAAPPEDVGGLSGPYEFLKVYQDEKHPEHAEIKAWAKSRVSKNMILKGLIIL